MLESFQNHPQKSAILAGLERVLNENYGHIKGLVQVTTIKAGTAYSTTIQRADNALIAWLDGSDADALRIVDLDDLLDMSDDYLITLDELKRRVRDEY